MKNYYFNPKTQDLMIFDNSTNQIDVLKVLKGIRVITSSEIQNPTDEEGRISRGSHISDRPRKKYTRRAKPAKPAKKGGKWKCKNCGELGHSAKTCKNPTRSLPPPSQQELPAEEVQRIAQEERTITI